MNTPQVTTPRPNIALINTVVYQCIYKSEDATTFQLIPYTTTVTGYTVQTKERVSRPPELSKDYQQFADIFSKQKAKLLPEHRLYDLLI